MKCHREIAYGQDADYLLMKFENMPLANSLLSSKDEEYMTYPLKVVFDCDTKLVHLFNNIDVDLLFPNDYVYDSSRSVTMIHHFLSAANELKRRFPDHNHVLEIGSNSGLFINEWINKFPVAVEPCDNFAVQTLEMGIPTYSSYWTADLAEELVSEYGKQDIIYTANTLSHVHNLPEFLAGVVRCLDSNGMFIIETPSLKSILEQNAFDQFYHEHQSYFSLISLITLLNRAGMTIFDVEFFPEIHGGTYRVYACLADGKCISETQINHNNIWLVLNEEYAYGVDDYRSLTARFGIMERNMKRTRDWLVENVLRNKCVGYGATAKFTQVCNMCGVDGGLIQSVMDTTPAKQGKYVPVACGDSIPIVPYTPLTKDMAWYSFLGAWNYESEIIEKERAYLEAGGKFVTHIPVLRVIDKDSLGSS